MLAGAAPELAQLHQPHPVRPGYGVPRYHVGRGHPGAPADPPARTVPVGDDEVPGQAGVTGGHPE